MGTLLAALFATGALSLLRPNAWNKLRRASELNEVWEFDSAPLSFRSVLPFML